MFEGIRSNTTAHEAVPEPGGDIVVIPRAGDVRPARRIWSKLKRNRAAMIALWFLAVMYAAAAFAGFLAPYSYDDADHNLPFHSPMISRVHVVDDQGRFRRPFVRGATVLNRELAVYGEDSSTAYPIRFFVRGDSYSIFWVVKSNVHLFGVDKPGHIFLLGADELGQDIFSRLLYGAQVSLTVGIVGIIISTSIGMLVGGVAGYFGGRTDFVLMRLVEILLALPALYFILIMRQLFGQGISSTQMYFVIVIILAFVGWATEARVIRGMVLSIKEQEYVIAARALGFSSTRIILRHILPNTMSFVIVTATLSVPFYILGEVALSFLGVGIQPPEASWGNMLTAAQNRRYLEDFPWLLSPGFLIFAAVMAWNFLGDGLRDSADPKS
jgi:peptide/nickel transport system permease protein